MNNKKNTQDHFEVLRKIQKKPKSSQRELAKELDFSLGKLNYCMKALQKKGFVKLKNFQEKSNKIKHLSYIITPKGIAERNMRLRKAQIELALGGNCSMLIWLGKQYLGQKESGVAPMRMPISGIQLVDDIDGSRLRSGENVKEVLPLVEEFGAQALLLNCSSPEAIYSAGRPIFQITSPDG